MTFQGYTPGWNYMSDEHCQIRSGILHTSEVQIYRPETISKLHNKNSKLSNT